MYKHTQRSFTGGRLDAELMGRQDLAQYFKGASELKNLSVRRQGYLSKRRGTTLACDLQNLLGHTTPAATEQVPEPEAEQIPEAEPEAKPKFKLVPLVQDKFRGYYILITAQRAFLCSERGIRLMDGTWARSIADYELTDYSAETVADDKRPYYIPVPYSDYSLANLDYAQSGDTVFLAHRDFCPAKIEFDPDSTSLSYTEMQFGGSAWSKPGITSAVKSVEGWGNGGVKTVYYVCTYVKDGIESEPSLPFGVTYNLPWGDKASITITCNKGNNETEPDYYNIYKKESIDYGVIASAGTLQNVIINDITIGAGSSAISGGNRRGIFDMYTAWWVEVSETNSPLISNKLNLRDSDIELVGSYRGGYFSYGCGGVNSGTGGLVLNFGATSNQVITSVRLGLDAFTINSTRIVGRYEDGLIDVNDYYSGVGFKAELVCRRTDITETDKTFTAYAYNTTQNALAPGLNERIFYSESVSTWGHSSNYRRVVEFDFAPAITAASPNGYGSNALDPASSVKFEIVSLTITAYSQLDSNNLPVESSPCNLYWREIAFSSIYSSSKVFTDDYITPDMTLSPPAVEAKFKSVGDYPGAVALYQQRLAYASTKNDPFTLWLSAVGDLYNFSTHSSIREDDALTLTLSATEFPDINHIIVNRDLMALSDGGEWIISPVSGNALTYKTASAKMQSAIGCAKGLKPITVNDEIIFVKQNGETLLATRYNFGSDGYESQDLSVLSQWMFKNNPIVQLCYRQNPDSVIVCALEDGTLADLVYMREHEVVAWNRAILAQGWKARGVACNKAISNGSSEVMILVEKNGAYALWRVRDDIPVRASSGLAALDHVCLDAIREVSSSYTPADGEYKFTDGATENPTYYAGLVFEAELVTVRPEIPNAQNTIQFELKNAKDAEIRILDSGDFTVRGFSVPESLASQVDTGAAISAATGEITLVSRDIKETLSGDNTGDGRISIKSSTPFPLNLLSISVDYEIQPLSGGAG